MGKVQDHKRASKAKHQVDFTDRSAASRGDRFEFIGEVLECLPNTMFRIRVKECELSQMVGRELLGTLAGKMRLYRIRVMPGDLVKGYISKYDLAKCKITYRTSKQRE
jgi:translation initiation factor IF-1